MSVSFKDVYRLSLQLSAAERQRLADILLNPPAPPSAEAIVATLEAHAEPLQAMGVQRIGVFGSFVRGEADPASDIDLLVDLAAPTFRGYMKLRQYLESCLGRPVDVVLANSVREELRDTIMDEVVYAQGF